MRIDLGDQLALRVTSDVTGQVEIPALGELDDVEPDAPARFDLLPFKAGRYAVNIVESGHAVGFIVVSARAGGQNDDSSSDSPGSSTAALTSGALRAS